MSTTKKKPKGRIVVESRSIDADPQHPWKGTITMQRELVNCGKKKCRKCRTRASHGPYWYAYRQQEYQGRNREAKTRTAYIGKRYDEEKARAALGWDNRRRAAPMHSYDRRRR